MTIKENLLKYFHWKHLSKIICIFGCFYHMSYICNQYLCYETITDVRYERDTHLSLPAITVCKKKRFVTNNYYKQFYDNINNTKFKYITNDYLTW